MRGASAELRSELRHADVATRSTRSIGTTAVVAVTAPDQADRAIAMLAADLRDLDEACSRFRPDSELCRLERTSCGHPVAVSPLLFDAIEVACIVAVQTAGVVDPTVGTALIELGYDRDFDEVRAAPPGTGRVPDSAPSPAPGWWQLALDPENSTVAIPSGIRIDLGATAKAFAADRAAQRISLELDCGALVNLGGDIAIGGRPPAGGWSVGIATDDRTPLGLVDQVVTVTSGGLATSGTTARSWDRAGRQVHHIVDPWTGDAAAPVWSLVSTTARSCVDANAWSTAAVVWGEDAIGNLEALDVPARLVDSAGRVFHVRGWPAEHDRAAERGGAPRDGAVRAGRQAGPAFARRAVV